MSMSPTPQPDWSRQPPPGAQPPPGWSQQPVPPGAPPPGHRRTGWLVGGVAAGVAVLLVGVGVVIVLLSSSDQTGPTTGTGPGATAPPVEATPAAPFPPPAPEIRADGDGLGEVALDLPPSALAIATITYQATAEFEPFTMTVFTSEGTEQPYYSTQGNHAGTHLLGEMQLFGPPATLQLDGPGSWTVHVQDIAHAPAWPVTDGDQGMVLRVEPGTLTSPVSVAAEHEGYFGVSAFAWNSSPTGDDFLTEDQLAVEFQGGTTSFEIPEQTSILRISADSGWTLELS